jgi:hypothetical protein
MAGVSRPGSTIGIGGRLKTWFSIPCSAVSIEPAKRHSLGPATRISATGCASFNGSKSVRLRKAGRTAQVRAGNHSRLASVICDRRRKRTPAVRINMVHRCDPMSFRAVEGKIFSKVSASKGVAFSPYLALAPFASTVILHFLYTLIVYSRWFC